MTVKLTKEQILRALRNGKVTYRPIGGHMTPVQAQKHLLKIADRLDEMEEVDLSLAFDHTPHRVFRHAVSRPLSRQNQRQ